jgi:hypothetical protein
MVVQYENILDDSVYEDCNRYAIEKYHNGEHHRLLLNFVNGLMKS